ncbi:sensor histidine kinase [Vallitalea pronyensis]|uniref:Sensor histidine kinase n=1 Tax=Vallitalea pronyensis TaxID=1348613 RepID=A0A8J8MH33_9FIRM|nr:sensor histidine kinase [Vallitalea pronyensis]QUI21426.1 sensor histidine kinase [Vallitalea pronyensis]
MKKVEFNSIWAKISIGFMIILVPIFILGYMSQKLAADELKQQTIQSTMSTIHQTSKNVDNIMTSIQELYKQISVDPRFQMYLASNFQALSDYDQHKKNSDMEDIFIEYANTNLYISKIILLVDEKKYVFPHTNGSSMSRDHMIHYIQQAAWYKDAVDKKGKLGWVGRHTEIDELFHSDDLIRDYAMSAVGMVKNYPVKKEMGILVFNINPINIRRVLEGVHLGSNSEVHLISPDGRDIYLRSRDNKMIMTMENTFNNEELLNATDKKGFSYEDYHGKKHLMIYESIGDTGYMVVGLIPESHLMQSSKKIKNLTYGLIFFIGLLVIIIGFYIVPRSISNRINVLIQKMIKVEQGDLVITQTIDSNDEIGIIDRHFNKMVKKLEALIQDNYVKQLKKREAELNALQFQINPHFLYNTLEIMNAIASVHKCYAICDISENLGEMFRYSISSDTSDFVNLSDELSHIKNYINIQKVRFGDRFEVYYDIEEGIEETKVLKFILQPIVENAMTHGFSKDMEKGFLEIAAFRDKHKLIIQVLDDGCGMDKDEVIRLNKAINEGTESLFSGDKSIGLKNVNMRIKLAYGQQYGIYLFSGENEGTRVIYTLPICEEYLLDDNKRIKE